MTAIASPELVSPEFLSLCQSQLRLLTQRLSESTAALYISMVPDTEAEQTNFVPVVSYPEPLERWIANFERATSWSAASHALMLPGTAEKEREEGIQAQAGGPTNEQEQLSDNARDNARGQLSSDRLLAGDLSEVSTGAAASDVEGGKVPPWEADRTTDKFAADEFAADEFAADEFAFRWPDVLCPEQQIVMPMVYTDVVVGLLVAVRPDRAWDSDERQYVERVAQSLAGGCVLERRNQWLQNQLTQKRGLQSRQSEVFHNLLHQFRNPLTAVSTFGQLLVKRLESEDPNQSIATGIVRENKRLRELVTHFDEAVAIGDADLEAQRVAQTSAQTVAQPGGAPRLLSSQPLLLAEPESTGLGHSLTLSAQYLPDIVAPVLSVASIVATESGVTLHAQVAVDTPLVWGEEEALGEVVSNLVDNAIKYSSGYSSDSSLRPQVWVQAGVSRLGSGLDGLDGLDGLAAAAERHYQGIVVGDTGPGIPAADLDRLFERNYRGVQAESDIPGTGLGLAIAQSLVHEMHGFIEVISPALGTPWIPSNMVFDADDAQGLGTVFIVWLLEVDSTVTQSV